MTAISPFDFTFDCLSCLFFVCLEGFLVITTSPLPFFFFFLLYLICFFLFETMKLKKFCCLV